MVERSAPPGRGTTPSPRGRVLIVDDDAAIGTVIVGLLRQGGVEARHCGSASEALDLLTQEAFDVVLTDLRMPGMDGLAFLGRLKEEIPDLPVVMLTAHGSVATAVEAMKAGAHDFLTKPFDREQVLFTVDKALASAARDAAKPPRHPREEGSLGPQRSAAMREVSDLVDRAARASATVLLRGESGTGKEVAARAIHAGSPRGGGPFVAVHCAALPDQLLESELFGYEKGAFTGATTAKPGRVRLAEGGTMFLDEIGDVSPQVQVKLLRLLQDKTYQPLGAPHERRADVRFVAATHRDLEALVESGDFREDLFYRLNVLPIWMPPLRERPEDVADLAAVLGARLAAENGRPALRFSAGALEVLAAHDWPGNVRELANVIERVAVFCDAEEVAATDVRRELDRPGRRNKRPATDRSLAGQRDEAERSAVLEALERAGGNRSKAARLLGVSRRTLYNRLNEIEPPAGG